jgi:hypothetical protein
VIDYWLTTPLIDLIPIPGFSLSFSFPPWGFPVPSRSVPFRVPLYLAGAGELFPFPFRGSPAPAAGGGQLCFCSGCEMGLREMPVGVGGGGGGQQPRFLSS